MSEFLSVPREEQFYSNNKKLAEAIMKLLPEPMVEPTGHNHISSEEFEFPERELYLYMIGFNLSGDPDCLQPVGLEVKTPVSERSGTLESYILSPEWRWRKGSDFYTASCSTGEYVLDEQGNMNFVPSLGHDALKNLRMQHLFADRKKRLKRKERKLAEKMLQISMDDERTERLLGYLTPK